MQKQILQLLLNNDVNTDDNIQNTREHLDINRFVEKTLVTNTEDNTENSEGQLKNAKISPGIQTPSKKRKEPRFIDTLLDSKFIEDMHYYLIMNRYSFIRTRAISTTEYMDFFTICENSPQHTNYLKMLNESEIFSFVKIYCELYGMNTEIDEDVLHLIISEMQKYIFKLYKKHQ